MADLIVKKCDLCGQVIVNEYRQEKMPRHHGLEFCEQICADKAQHLITQLEKKGGGSDARQGEVQGEGRESAGEVADVSGFRPDGPVPGEM